MLQRTRHASAHPNRRPFPSPRHNRTPARLIAAQPMLGATQAEAETGARRAAVQRNLDLLQARGLVRAVAGQGRFRIRAAKLQGVGPTRAALAFAGLSLQAGRGSRLAIGR
jgi:hypothetical protein